MDDVHGKVLIAVLLWLHWPGICGGSEEEMIAGGVPAKLGDFPFAVFLVIRRGKKFNSCTGSIIDPRWILTAAHCTLDSNEVTVYAGVTEPIFGNRSHEQVRKALQHIIYPDYVNKMSIHFRSRPVDYALVRLDRSFDIDNSSVSVAELEGASWRRNPRSCTAVGYGNTPNRKPGKLFSLNIDVLYGYRACPCIYKKKEIENFICLSISVSGLTICPGDSGGPLICDNRVTGVGSFIYPKDQCNLFNPSSHSRIGCGFRGTVSTYVYVCPVLSWIRHYVGYRIPSHC